MMSLPVWRGGLYMMSLPVWPGGVFVLGSLCPGGSLSREKPPYSKEWAVCVLLECIFVQCLFELKGNLLLTML